MSYFTKSPIKGLKYTVLNYIDIIANNVPTLNATSSISSYWASLVHTNRFLEGNKINVGKSLRELDNTCT